MKITDITFNEHQRGAMRAFCTLVFDEQLALHGLKLIQPTDGRLLVAFPSHPVFRRCPHCDRRNSALAGWCNWCGVEMPRVLLERTALGRPRTEIDFCHPVTNAFRQYVTETVLAAYQRWSARAAEAAQPSNPGAESWE
jgi:DNA-binding cell septation regulator SpoVG